MEKQIVIRNKIGIPDTHYFVYKDKRYPIKYDFFKYSSNYFSKNQVEIQRLREIQLVDNEIEKDSNLTDELIESFINYIQCKDVVLNYEKSIVLNYLSNKYEVFQLKEITRNYILQYFQDQILFNMSQSHSIIETLVLEDIIAGKFDEYIDDDRLLTLNIRNLHRIIQKYSKKSENRKFFDFLFRCLDKYGHEASILFGEIDFGNSRSEYITRLLNDYSTVFDFTLIYSLLVKTLHEKQNEEENKADSIPNNTENKEQNLNASDQLSSEITRLQTLLEQLRNEQKEEEKEKGIPLLLKEDEEFNGIVKYLTNKTGGNIHENGTIKITSNTFYDGGEPKNLLDFTDKNYYRASRADSYITFDFKSMKVKVTNYSIKSNWNGPDAFHMRSWEVEVSNDEVIWKKIDERKNCQDLNGKLLTGTFDVLPNGYSRYVRVHQTDRPWGRGDHIWFFYMELYGFLQE